MRYLSNRQQGRRESLRRRGEKPRCAAMRTTSGCTVPDEDAEGAVLDARGVSTCKPDDMGTG